MPASVAGTGDAAGNEMDRILCLNGAALCWEEIVNAMHGVSLCIAHVHMCTCACVYVCVCAHVQVEVWS